MFLKKIIALSVFTLILLFGLFALDFGQAEAACQPSNVSGWTWSDSIGWVSLSCTNHAGTINYGVSIGTNGAISGFAWSDAVGWISFNATDLTGCPHGTCSASLLTNNNLSGWARVLTTGEWISLAGTIGGGGTYGATLIHPQFHGWAWGDQIVGWLSWNCANIAGECARSSYMATTSFTFNLPPQATNATSTIRYCDHFVTPQVATGTTVALRWSYSDPENVPQHSYEIQVSDFSNFSTIRFGQIVPSSAQSHSLDTPLSWNTTYHWRVRVFDGASWSGWLTSQFTIANLHASPLVVFSFTPHRITTNEVVTFINQETVGGVTTTSRVFDGNAPIFNWTFQGGSPATSTSVTTVTTTFGVVGTREATLRVTESGPTGYSCVLTRSLNVAVPLPDWREITPFGRIRLFLSDVAQRFQSLFAIHY